MDIFNLVLTYITKVFNTIGSVSIIQNTNLTLLNLILGLFIIFGFFKVLYSLIRKKW